MDARGDFVSFETYRSTHDAEDVLVQALSTWSMTIREKSYQTAVDIVEVNPDANKDVDWQTMAATNSLVGTKDAKWHKEWKDIYRYEQGQRPDIYLDIYRMVHTGQEQGNTQVELYQANYRWEGKAESDTVSNWTAVIEGLPKYDSYGYEITYYAVECTVVTASNFDYAPVKYYWSNGGNGFALGDREEVADAYQNDTTYVYHLTGQNPVYDIGGKDVLVVKNRYSVPVNYALAENGTFQNTLEACPNLAGEKLWTSVPAGFAKVDLPPVTFALYQSLDGQTDSTSTPVATLTVTDWASVETSGSYIFRFVLQGNWSMKVENDKIVYTNKDNPTKTVTTSRDCVVEGTLPEGVTFLPKYKEDGQLYTYTMVEQSITLDDNGQDVEVPLDETATAEEKNLFKQIFTSAGVTPGTYQANNAYNTNQEGELTVQKWLKLEKNSQGNYVYPAITLELSRTYPSAAQGSQMEYVATQTWSSAQVEEAFDAQAKETWHNEGWVRLEATLTGLEIYAVNGEKYQYSFVENTGELKGYNTWAQKGGLEYGNGWLDNFNENNQSTQVPGLNAHPATDPAAIDATFINSYDSPVLRLQGTKQWDDWADNQHRPTIENGSVAGITLEVSRTAPAQTGQGNGYSETLELNTDYTVTWTQGAERDQWTYTIQAAAGKTEELSQYAPNGMPWTYRVTETIEDDTLAAIYGGGRRTVTFNAAKATNGTGTLLATPNSNLVNSIKTTAVFQKQWENGEDDPIQTDYLGQVKISFKLQVREKGATTWKDASEYAKENQVFSSLLGQNYEFTKTKTAAVNAEPNAWKDTFTGLPSALVNTTGSTPAYTLLEYRVVETQIVYTVPGGTPGETQTTVTVTVNDQGVYTLQPSNTLISGAGLAVNGVTSTTTNTLKTVDLTVTKTWTTARTNTTPAPPMRQGIGKPRSWCSTRMTELPGQLSRWPIRTRGSGTHSLDRHHQRGRRGE